MERAAVLLQRATLVGAGPAGRVNPIPRPSPFSSEALHEILADEVGEFAEAVGEDHKRRVAGELAQTLSWIWVVGK